MTRITTEETIKNIKRQARYIKADGKRDGLTKEQWLERCSQYEDVVKTLSFMELKLIFLTRQCPIGTAFRFIKAAEAIIAASTAMNELTE